MSDFRWSLIIWPLKALIVRDAATDEIMSVAIVDSADSIVASNVRGIDTTPVEAVNIAKQIVTRLNAVHEQEEHAEKLARSSMGSRGIAGKKKLS